MRFLIAIALCLPACAQGIIVTVAGASESELSSGLFAIVPTRCGANPARDQLSRRPRAVMGASLYLGHGWLDSRAENSQLRSQVVALKRQLANRAR